MIFVTIGCQEPFERLISAMDEIAPAIKIPIVCQTFPGGKPIKNMQVLGFIPAQEFNSYLRDSDLIVAHAGMGTIISSLVLQRQIVVLPRLKKYGETRNDHQLATAIKMEELKLVHVAYNEVELKSKILEALQKHKELDCKIGTIASQSLLYSMKEFIEMQ